jgi:hypothetical protein
MTQLAIVEAFSDLIDTRCGTGKRHQQALCLAMFTALQLLPGTKVFSQLGIGEGAHKAELVKLFQPPKGRIPSYSTIRRTKNADRVSELFSLLIPFFWCSTIAKRNNRYGR